jgi:hypothetical protein
MFGRRRGYPGNRRIVADVAYETPVREVEYVYGLQGVQLAGMHQRAGLRYGHGQAGDFGAAGFFVTGPMPALQGFIGAEAFRLAATRAAERRDYDPGQVEQVVFSPLGAL